MAKKKGVKNSSKKKHAAKRNKQENLELAANIAVKENVEKPIIPQISNEANKIEAAQEHQEKLVQQDPVYAEDVKANIPTVKEEKTNSKAMRNTVLIVSAIILAFWMILIILSISPKPDTISEKNVTVTITEPIKVNFERYSNATSQIAAPESSLIAYLREETVQKDRAALEETSFYAVDDYGNRIRLMLDFNDRRNFDLLFKDNTTTDKTYNITGSFKYDQFSSVKYTFNVDNITFQQKPTHEYDTTRLQNVTNEGKGIIIDLTLGWKRLTRKA